MRNVFVQLTHICSLRLHEKPTWFESCLPFRLVLNTTWQFFRNEDVVLARTQKSWNGCDFCMKKQRVCQPVFVDSARWMEEEEADDIWRKIFITCTKRWWWKQMAWQEVMSLPVWLKTWRRAWERPWLGREWRELTGRCEGGDFVISKQARSALWEVTTYTMRHCAVRAHWPWEERWRRWRQMANWFEGRRKMFGSEMCKSQ